jgi:hypothetical protein
MEENKMKLYDKDDDHVHISLFAVHDEINRRITALETDSNYPGEDGKRNTPCFYAAEALHSLKDWIIDSRN